MPRIPQAEQAGLRSMNVPTTPTMGMEAAGMVGRAQAGLAQTAAGIANDFNDKLMQAEESAIASEKRTAFALRNDQIMAELKSDERLSKDPSKFTEEYQKRISKEKQTLLKDVKIPRYKGAAEASLRDIEYNGMLGAQAYQRNERVRKAYETHQLNANERAHQLTLNFDESFSLRESANLKLEIAKSKDILYTSEQVDEMHKEIDNKFYDAMVQNGLNNSESAPRILSILNKQNTQSPNLLRGIDSEKIGRDIARLTNISEQNRGVKKSQINDKFADIQTQLKNLKPVDASEFSNLTGEIASSGFDDAPELLDTATTLKVAHGQLDKFLLADKGTRQRMLDEDLPLSPAEGSFNAAQRDRLNVFSKEVLAGAVKYMEEKGADFALERRSDLQGLSKMAGDLSDPNFSKNVRQYVNTVNAVQEKYGIANKKVLNKELTNLYAGFVKNEDGEIAAQAITSIRDAYGPQAGQVMKELIESKAIDKQYAIAFYGLDENTTAAALNNLRNQKEIETAFKSKKNFRRGSSRLCRPQG